MTMNSNTHAEYWAISIVNSRTFWLNTIALLVEMLSVTEVLAIVPQRWMPAYTALIAVANIALRFQTVRPVALIAPGTTKPVTVKKISPPPPEVMTD